MPPATEKCHDSNLENNNSTLWLGFARRIFAHDKKSSGEVPRSLQSTIFRRRALLLKTAAQNPASGLQRSQPHRSLLRRPLCPRAADMTPQLARLAAAPPSRAVRLRPTPEACSGTADVMPGRFPRPVFPLLPSDGCFLPGRPSIRTPFCGPPRGSSGAYQAEAVPDAGLPS